MTTPDNVVPLKYGLTAIVYTHAEIAAQQQLELDLEKPSKRKERNK